MRKQSLRQFTAEDFDRPGITKNMLIEKFIEREPLNSPCFVDLENHTLFVDGVIECEFVIYSL